MEKTIEERLLTLELKVELILRAVFAEDEAEQIRNVREESLEAVSRAIGE